jgi:primosomal protein N''
MTPQQQAELAAKLFAPSATTLARYLPDMGDCLAGALVQLSRDPDPQRCDDMARRLQAASHAISRLRAALVAEAGGAG